MESDDPDADTASILPQLILIVVLTAVNAFLLRLKWRLYPQTRTR